MRNYNKERSLRIWELAALLALSISLCAGAWAEARQSSISSRLIRLHVIAASDETQEQEIKLRVREAARLTGLTEDYLEKSPFELSGGEKRRVAIAGVLAMQPEVLILDEPTAGLDPKGREYILSEIKAYHEKRGATVILVSHSMEDVARFASHVLIMNHSKVAMYGKTREVFARVEELVEMGLEVPQISRVFAKLAADGVSVPESVLTVAEAKAAVLGLLGKGGEC